jgi:GDP-L-fucose synthase
LALVPEQEHTISELAETIANIYGIREIQYDTTKADGQFRKTMSNGLMRSHLKGFRFTPLREGLLKTVAELNSHPKL